MYGRGEEGQVKRKAESRSTQTEGQNASIPLRLFPGQAPEGLFYISRSVALSQPIHEWIDLRNRADDLLKQSLKDPNQQESTGRYLSTYTEVDLTIKSIELALSKQTNSK